MIEVGREVAEFASGKLGYQLVPPYTILGTRRDGKVAAAMVFNHWTGPDIHVTVAADRGLPKALIKAAGEYVFGQLKCCRATLLTESEKVAGYGRRLGAEVEGMCRDQYGEGRPGYRLAFFKDAWRF